MGHDPDEPYYPFGNNCLACFDPGATPLHRFVTFTGVTYCDPGMEAIIGPIVTDWKLTQHDFDPCFWQDGEIETWLCEYAANGVICELRLMYGGLIVFYERAIEFCETEFTNDTDCEEEEEIGENGTASVTVDDWSPAAREMLYEQNLNPMVDSYYERWDADNEGHVYRFANILTPMNIYVLYEAE